MPRISQQNKKPGRQGAVAEARSGMAANGARSRASAGIFPSREDYRDRQAVPPFGAGCATLNGLIRNKKVACFGTESRASLTLTVNLGARYGQHDPPNHPSRRLGSVRWWLVRPGTLVLVQTSWRGKRPPQLAASFIRAVAGARIAFFRAPSCRRIETKLGKDRVNPVSGRDVVRSRVSSQLSTALISNIKSPAA